MVPTRVLLIAPSLRIVGGQAVQAERLRSALEKERSVELEFLPIDPDLPLLLRPFRKIKYVRTAVNTAWFLFKLIAAMWRADVVHVFAATGASFYLHPVPALIFARLFRRKIILNFRDGRIENQLKTRPGILRRISRFDAVITPSEYLVSVFAKHGVSARSIPNLIDVERFQFRERARPAPVFLHNRALEPLYDVPCTIRAFASIQKRYPEAVLRLAHEGPLRSELERLIAVMSVRNVQFLGKISREQTPRTLDEADIYLTSPRVDNMPGSVLECFAAGLPVVATRAGGIPWVIEHERTGLLVDCADAEAMAQAAIRLIEEPGLALRLARAAREECEKYRWTSAGRLWLELYGQLKGGS